MRKRNDAGHRQWSARTGLAAVLVLLSACGGTAAASGGGMMDHRDAMSPDGEQCYQFERNAAADRLALPWGFVRTHDYISGQGRTGVHRAWTLTGPDTRRDFPFAMWRHAEDGLYFGPEISGSIALLLRPDGNRMVGSGRFIGDAVRPGQTIDRSPIEGVVAQQVLCGAEPGGSAG